MNEYTYNNSDPTKPTFIEGGELDKIREEFDDLKCELCTHGNNCPTGYEDPIDCNDFESVFKSRDEEIKKLRKALEEIRDNIPRGHVGRPYQIAYEALKDIT